MNKEKEYNNELISKLSFFKSIYKLDINDKVAISNVIKIIEKKNKQIK